MKKKNVEYKSLLDGENYDYTVPKDAESSAEKAVNNSLSRRTKLIIILLAFIAAIIPVYIFLLVPMLETGTNEDLNNELPEVHYSEVILDNKYLCMMPQIADSEIDSVTIHNKIEDINGDYKYQNWSVYYNTEDRKWAIRNYENTTYDSASISTLIMYFTIMNVSDRIEYKSVDEIDMSLYGLDDDSMPVSYTIKTADGKSYTVTMGSTTTTSSGYYAVYTDESGNMRPTVYIISSYYGSLINCSVYDLISPLVSWALDKQDYVPSIFEVFKNGSEYFTIKKLTEEEIAESNTAKASHLYTTIDGVRYEFDASADYSALLYESFVDGLYGSKVVYAKQDSENSVAEDILASFGIDKDKAYFQLRFNSKVLFSATSSHSMEQLLMFSKKTKNLSGNEIYYVYNVKYGIISEIQASKVGFVEKDLSYYCEQYILLLPYYNISTIKIDSTALSDVYTASGLKRINEMFTLTLDDEKKLTDVRLSSTGESVVAPSGTTLTGLNNFSLFYRVLLSLSTQVEVPEGVIENIDLNKPDITVTIEATNGKVNVMRFYLYNSRHAYYTLDGLGRSYVKYDDLVKLLDSTSDLIEGKKVDVGYTSNSADNGITEAKPSESRPEETGDFNVGTLIIVLVIVIVAGAAAVIVTLKVTKKRKEEKE